MSPHPITTARGTKSVETLAQESGVPPLTIARLEAGITRRPSRSTLQALATALATDVDELELAVVRHHQVQGQAA